MLKSILKLHRGAKPVINQRWSFQSPSPQYSIFNLFKKKKEEQEIIAKEKEDLEKELADMEAEAKRAAEEDKFVDKKQYFEKLKKEREEYESKNEKLKREFEFEEQRDRRQYQINVAQVDYSRVAQENVGLEIKGEFKHLEELYYFISNLRVRLNEENIKKVLEGFLALAERINTKDLEKPQYFEFIEILKSNVMLISNNETLLLMLRFADLYIVEDAQLWTLLERKIFQRFQQFSSEELVRCVINFGNQNEGSDQFYDQFEKVITDKLPELEIRQLVAVSQSYFQVKRGTREFFDKLHKEMMNKIDSSSTSDLIRLCIVYNAIDLKEKFKVFEKLEVLVAEKIDVYNIPEICIIAESFGLEYGDAEFLKLLEKRVIASLGDLEYDQLVMVLRGFVYTYRGSKQLFSALKERLVNLFPRMDLPTLSMVAKAYHITENDDKQFEAVLERHVINNLKRMDDLTIEDLFEVVSSYNVTRIGSRELYKILEFVLREKMGDIAKNPEIARGMYYLYTTSGLCSPELLRKLQFIV